MANEPERKLLTEEQAKEREERLRAAGITPRREQTSIITLLRKREIEDPLEDDDGSGRRGRVRPMKVTIVRLPDGARSTRSRDYGLPDVSSRTGCRGPRSRPGSACSRSRAEWVRRSK